MDRGRLGFRGAYSVFSLAVAACGPGGGASIPEEPVDVGSERQALSSARVPQSQVNLPADERAHDLPLEWWYFTGSLKVPGGHSTYGIETVIFQIFPPTGQTSPYYMGHAALSDPDRGVFQQQIEYGLADERASQPPLGYDLTAGTIGLRGNSGTYHVSAEVPGYRWNLIVSALKPAASMDGDGLQDLGNNAMYYYSHTRMAAVGTLTENGVSVPVAGTLWNDHQWGALGSNLVGWNWFSLRMDDFTELMVDFVRLIDGTVTDTATLVRRHGFAETLPPGAVTVEPTGSWTSAVTGAVYPQGWLLSSAHLDLDVQIEPVMPNQELIYSSAPGGPEKRYWEGLCHVHGSREGRPIRGDAYVELTGY